MDNTIYDAPTADLNDAVVAPKHEFYVVSTLKFSILFLGTFSLYSVYWFYKNWKMFKDFHNEDIIPVARAIFSIFFVHSLFAHVDRVIVDKDIEHRWFPSLLATLFILLAIGSAVADAFSNNESSGSIADVISIVMMFPTCFILARAQIAINVSQDDERGTTNSKLGFLNYLWCALGGLIWLLAFAGLAVLFGLIDA